MPRTVEEIVKRAHSPELKTMFGFGKSVLIEALGYELSREYGFLKEDAVVPEEDQWPQMDEAQIRTAAIDYLAFAFGKAEDHRGISANRSVEKMREYAWLLERDDAVEAMNTADYQNYGVPKLIALATVMEWPIPKSQALENMAQGKACEQECQEGCV